MKLCSLPWPSLVLAAVAAAQPSTVMRPTLLADFQAEVAHASREGLDRGDTPSGEVGVTSARFSVGARYQPDTTAYLVGIAAATHELDVTGALLPERVAELSVNLGLQRPYRGKWIAAFYARPGFYGDFEEVSDSFNVPVLALAHYRRSADLTWSFGLNANALSDNPVLPIVGVSWRFAPDWQFQLGFPQSGLTRRLSDQLSLRTGVSFSGGSFRVTRNLGVPAPGIARLANTRLDFREVRAGLGADWKLGRDAVLSVDLGAVSDRKFDYIDRNYRLDGDGGYFVALAIRRDR